MSKINLVTDEGEFVYDVESGEAVQKKLIPVSTEKAEKLKKLIELTAKMDAAASVAPITMVKGLEERVAKLEDALGKLQLTNI